MHKIFGERLPVAYHDRYGAYLIAIRGGRIAAVKVPKGYFLPGGGTIPGESDQETILRECREETGCDAAAERFVCSAEAYCEHPVLGHFHPIQRYYLGTLAPQTHPPTDRDHQLLWLPYRELKGSFYLEMQNWALEQCWEASQIASSETAARDGHK